MEGTIETMTGYHVPVAMHGEMNLADLGTVAYDFEAGTIETKDPTDAAVLAVLAQNGLVELAAPKPKGKAAKSEPITDAKE